MEISILILHILTAAAIIAFVLLQHGKGADVGAAFGGGASGSVFGAAGSANFLSRTTGILAAMFFVTSLGLTYISTHKDSSGGVMVQIPLNQSGSTQAPVQPVSATTGETQYNSKSKNIPN